MLISIIVPVYNAEAYLSRCIYSLLHQTYSDIEIILIDDGSTDNSYSLCQELAASDSRIIVFHQENKGVSAARNQGIRISSGSFILFVDSDDYADPDLCRQLADASVTAYTVFCGYYFVCSQNNQMVSKKAVLPPSQPISSLIDFKKNYGNLLNNKILLSPWAKLFSADIIKTHHLQFHEDLHIGEDLTFVQDYLQALPDMQISMVPQPLYYYDIKEDASLSSRFDLSRLTGSCQLYHSMLKFCDNMKIYDSGAPYASLYYFRSCSVLINKLMNHPEQMRYMKRILHFPETKQALKLIPKFSAEGLYYSIAFRMPPFFLKQFIKLRQWIIRKLRGL